MKILFLVPNPIGTIPGQRFRFEQYLSHLLNHGIEYMVCPFASSNLHKILYKKGHFLKKCLFTIFGYFHRISNIIQAFNYDLIFIYREITPLGPPIFEKTLHLIGKPIIYDFDDAIYLPSSSAANRFIRFLKFPKKTNEIMKLSKLILAGNKNLQKYALQFNTNTLLLPTVINTELYMPEKDKKRDKICLGWSGSHTTIAHLNLLKEVLRKIYIKYKINIKVIGSNDFFIPGLKINAQDWKLDSELWDLREIDIGIMPLPDDEWAKGKCGLKALQYMALEIPTVCSPVGVNAEIIDDGINGFLCSNEDEWIKKLSILIENPELRKKMGLAGRKTIEKKYSVKANISKFIESLYAVYKEKYGDN